jgi:hypothetical protein
MDLHLKEGFEYRASDLVATYTGLGVLSTDCGAHIACQFQADQEFSGGVQVILHHILPTDFAFHVIPLMETGAGVAFRGRTNSGATLVMASDHAGRPLALDADGYGSIYFLPHKVTVYDKRSRTILYRFLLTNFAFSPFTHLGEPPHQPPPHVLSLNIDAQTVKIEIRPLPDYVDRIVRLWQTRAIIPTCELEITPPEGSPSAWPFHLVAKVCKLLSVAAGTVIEWIVADGLDQETQRTHSIHAARRTKPFCSLPIIPINELGYEANSRILQTFLQEGLEQISGHDGHLINGLIAAFLDARLEGDYLESRGIKTVVVLEMLKNLFTDEYCQTEWNSLLPRSLRRNISNIIQCALKERKIESGPSQAVQEALGQLSRPTFKRIMLYMIGKLALVEKDSLVKGVMQARNSLVHTGQFLSMRDPEKAKEQGFTDAVHEFFLLLSFADRVLLRVLGYSGVYTDYSECTQLRFFSVMQELPVRPGDSAT